MSHVNHQQCIYLISNLAHAFIIPLTAVSRTTTDNKLWLVLTCETLHLIIVNTTSLTVQCIANMVIKDTRCIHLTTMREMTALVKIKSHECVAWFQHGKQHSLVSLRARVRLHIGIFSTKELLYTLNGKCFNLVNHLTTTIIAFAWITFSILVC